MTTAVKDLTSGFGTVSYNGYTFGPLRRCRLECEPQYDRADWTVTSQKWKLTVHAIIHATSVSNQQTAMDSLHSALLEAGGTLVISDIGFSGGVNTGISGTTPDLIWGAKPRHCQMSPVGGDLCWEVVWQCEFNIGKCGQNANDSLMAFNYEIFYATNDRGYVTRRISGYLEIPQVRSGFSRRPPRDVENFYSRITFNVPSTFRRITSTRQISPDRRRIDFTVIDQELETLPFPDGIVHADFDYSWENRPPGFINWTGTLSGTMEVAPGYPPSLAAAKFFILLFDKAAALQAAAAKFKGIVIPERLAFGQKVFGRESKFSATFRFVGCLQELMESGGVWRPMPGTNYSTWQASMAAVGMYASRGRYGLRHNLTEDAIVDLCANVNAANIGNETGGATQPISGYTQVFNCGNVSKETSWLAFRNRIRAVVLQRGTVHRLAQVWDGIDLAATLTSGTQGVSLPLGAIASGGRNAAPHIFQYEGAADNLVLMQGQGFRIKYAPDIPKLVSIGGQAVEELARNQDCEPVANFFHCPLYLGRWAILYRVKSGQLQTMQPADNKPLCIPDGEKTGV